MVGVFVRLKLRMLRHRLGTAGLLPMVGFILVWFGTIGAGVAGAAVLGLVPRFVSEGARLQLVVVVYTALAAAWLIGPVVAASVDDSLDVRKFELMPLGRTRLAVGLVAAAIVGPGGIATSIGIVGGTLIGYGGPVSLLPILIVAVVYVLLVVVTARLALTALADLVRSRRSREVAAIVIGLAFALPAVVSVTVTSGSFDLTASVDTVIGPMLWLPPGALARAVVSFSDGRWLPGALGLSYGAAALAAVTWGYGRAIGRLNTTGGSAETRPVRGSGALRSWVPLPAGPSGGVAAKELIYLRRDPRLRSQLMGTGIGVVLLGAMGITIDPGPYGPFYAVFVAFMVVAALGMNQFGHDGGSIWGYLVAAPDLRTVLIGKNVAWAVFSAPLLILASVGGAIVGRSAVYVIPALLAAAAILVVWLAVGNYTSVFGPVRLQESNPFGNRSMSGAAFLASMGGLLAAGTLSIPVVFAVVFPVVLLGPVWATVGAAASAGYAVAVYWLTTRKIGSVLGTQTFKVLEVIDGD